jgi:hypothetical protein
VAAIIRREIETANWTVYHLMAKKDVNVIHAARTANGNIKLDHKDVSKGFRNFYNLFNRKKESGFGFNGEKLSLTSKDVLYTNIPIIVDDGTYIAPVSSGASGSVNGENQTALKNADKRVKNSAVTSKNNVPDWFDINLSQPSWSGEKAVGIDGRFSRFRFFPSDEEIKIIEEKNNNFYHIENYKCAATIVRNDGRGNTIAVRHVFVRKDAEELNAK